MGRFYVGTSGFGYREWVGKFFPRGLKADQLLPYYAARFDTVEINSSFYRMPRASVVRGWLPETPKGFRFSFKAPASITHMRRLSNAGASARAFLKAIDTPKLGVAVFQLPPGFKKDVPRLRDFIDELPRGRDYAFEFRDPTWFAEDVLAVLERARIALCYNDADVERCPLVATAKFGVVKLRRVDYAARELARWARRLEDMPWTRADVFFKHETRATGPVHAAALRRLLD